jgi:transposase
MPTITVGVDVGKASHQAAAYDLSTNRIVAQLTFPVSRAGFERFRAFLARLAPAPADLLVGLEATGHYHRTLAEDLQAHGYPVTLVNPRQAHRFRQAEGRRAKTDRLDARALARQVAVHAPPPLEAADATLAGLRELTRFRAELVHDRTMAVNRLHGAVDQAFPELRRALGPVTSRVALALLAVYPTAGAVAVAEPAALAALLREASRGQRGLREATALIAAAQASVGVRTAAPALALTVAALVRQVVALNGEIAALEAAIGAAFATLGLAADQFPVRGVVALATILAEAGDVRRFPSAKHFLAHFGWCPQDAQSGQYRNPHPPLSKAGNRYVRRVLWMLAVGAISRPGPYRDYFLRRTAAGKNKMHSLVAIGRKLLTTIYAILKTGRPFDPAYRHPGRPAAPLAMGATG